MYLQLFSFFAGNWMYTRVTIKAHGSLVLQMQSLFTHIYWYKIVMIFLRILNLLLFVDYFQSNYYFKKGNFCYKYGIIKSIYILIFILISSCLINSLWKAISWTFYTSALDLSQFRPVYAPKDFLEVIIGLQNPNYHGSDTPGYVIYKGSLAQPSSGTS